MNTRLTIAIQKKGRLNLESVDLLKRCGLQLKPKQNALLCHAENLPLDILFIRDDDIPTFTLDGVCDLGIVGENVLYEKKPRLEQEKNSKLEVLKKLGFGRCRLSIAIPESQGFLGPQSLQKTKIATSYPHLLSTYLKTEQIQAEIITLAGSVEIAPNLNMAEAICDLVSSGRTLEENKLKEVTTLLESQAVLIKTNQTLSQEKQATLDLLLRRIDGVLKAQECKYILFHAEKSALPVIKKMIPGCESPSVLPLDGFEDKVAVHVVSREAVFWNTLEALKQAGASSILVLPIEKMMD